MLADEVDHQNTFQGSGKLPSNNSHESDKPRSRPKRDSRQPRERDDLFDAVAEVTSSDPRASGSYIGRTCKALRDAEPPYTPDEVREWARRLKDEGWMQGLPTLGFLEKTIGRVRAPSAASKVPTDEDLANYKPY